MRSITMIPAAEAAALVAALGERDRLENLLVECNKAAPTVTTTHATAGAAFDAVETELALAGPDASAKLKKKHDAARIAALEAENEQRRHNRIVAAMPALLAAADAELERAAQGYQADISALRQSVVAELDAELRDAVRQLGKTLEKIHATSSGLAIGNVRRLDDAIIPSIGGIGADVLYGTRLATETGGTVDLSTSWQNNPDLVALHATLRPVVGLLQQAEPHMRRITR
jgi:hypothetical protein